MGTSLLVLPARRLPTILDLSSIITRVRFALSAFWHRQITRSLSHTPDTHKYPREESTRAIEAEGGMGGTSDIAESVDCQRETAYKKLSRMADDGEVIKQKTRLNLCAVRAATLTLTHRADEVRL